MRRRALCAASAVSGGRFDINNYLTIDALEDGLTASLSTNACEYRIDNGEWRMELVAHKYSDTSY